MKRVGKITALLFILVLGLSASFTSNHGKYFEISKNLEIFTNLYKEINTYYVDELDPGKLMRIGVDAMLESLDPYTNYISESEIEGFRYITEGKYNGIGAQSKLIDGYITITQLYKDQPADKANMKVGDQIVEIDGNNVVGKTSEDINNLLRGFPGTNVALKIKRPGIDDALDITLTRDEVNLPNVPYHGMVSDDVGYFALTVFTREAGRNVSNALKTLKEENPNLKGVVFDLRGNPGGLLTEAVNVSNVFVPKGELIVTTKGKVKEWDRSFKTLNQPVDEEIPVVVLIDNNSASASEIVSGVIQDLDRGVLMGQRSYGKGLVQNTRDIGYNSKVKLTTAKYYIPSGRCIQSVSYKDGEPVDVPDTKRAAFKTRNGRKVLDGGGVKPDVIVDLDGASNILTTLEKENYIFNYVTEFCENRPSIDSVDVFQFTEFDGFMKFLERHNFEYNTPTEQLISDLMIKSKDDGYALDSAIKVLEQQIIEEKRNNILAHKDEVIDMIEKEIISRYYYEKGRIQIGLRNDEEIEAAVDLIHDSAKYNSLLK